MKKRERSIARELRRDGLSYQEIIDVMAEEGMKVSKGALNSWLSDAPLSEKGARRLKASVSRKRSEASKKAVAAKRAKAEVSTGDGG